MMKRKFWALFLTAALALSVTACGNDSSAPAESGSQTEESAEAPAEEEEVQVDPMEAALENMDAVSSMEAKMIMNMDMVVSANGQEQSMESVTTMDMACFNDPLKIKMEMTIEAAGESQEMSVYGEEEDGTYMMYVYDGSSWQSQEVERTDLGEFDARDSMLSSIGDGSVYTAEGEEQIDGANAYKYSYVMTEEETKQAVLSSGALDQLSSLGIDESQIEGMLSGLGDITTYVWIDAETLYPIRYEMDMTDVMDALMVSMVEAIGEQAEGLSMNVPKMEIIMTCSNFNNVADFSVPDEAKAN